MVSFPARRIPRSHQRNGWDALADIEVFIYAAEAELEAMEAERVGVHRRGCKPDSDLRRRVLGLIWRLTFGDMPWRIAGLLSGLPFTTLHSAFARWTRLGLWRRLGQRLARRVRRRGSALCGRRGQPLATVSSDLLDARH